MYRSEEDYLKKIYELSIESSRNIVKTSELAEELGFTDQSINEKIKQLVAKDLVVFEPYKGVSLTKKGSSEALRMVRAHRIWEVFLANSLGYSWSDVHDKAEDLEHASSIELINRLYLFLDSPAYCLHGNPIPNLKGKMARIADISIADLQTGTEFTLQRVIDNKSLLLFLEENDIKLYDHFLIEENNEFTSIISIRSFRTNTITQISTKIAKLLFTYKE